MLKLNHNWPSLPQRLSKPVCKRRCRSTVALHALLHRLRQPLLNFGDPMLVLFRNNALLALNIK